MCPQTLQGGLAHLKDVAARRRGYFAVPKVNEMLRGEFGAVPVVYDDRIDIIQA